MSMWLQRLTRSLELSHRQPESRFLQLATVDADNRPDCRTVVFRDIENKDTLLVISDTRSRKWQQLQQNPQACLCWYFSKTREQYRFDTEAELCREQQDVALVSKHWKRLSESAKKQFLWGAPMSPRDNNEPLRSQKDSVSIPEHFCVLKFKVKRVDYLNLRGNPQYREIHRFDDNSASWSVENVIP